MFFESMMNSITTFIEKRKAVGIHSEAQLYNEEQLLALRQVENEALLREAEGDRIPEAQMVGPSYGSSTSSFPTSGSRVTARVGLNKLGMPYFESIESRLQMEEEEFFKKEDFDIEE